MEISQLVFYLFAGLAVASSVLMITRKNPVYAAMYLVVTLFSVAALFVLLDAHFLAALQVVLYAGAILVLFLFVIMLLNLGHELDPDIRGKFWWAIGFGLSLVLFAELFVLARSVPEAPGPEVLTPLIETRGAVGAVAEPLFENYVVAVEVTGVLLLVAMVGAVVIAKRRV
jgi:NADH-quinone oxidoreductase subunit J